MIGNLLLKWEYWKTGTVLALEDQVLLRMNSLRSDEFEDPLKREVLSETQKKVKYFCYKGRAGQEFVPRIYTEVIEIIVPEVQLIHDDGDTSADPQSMSAKILTKALEIVDEVLKNHCENLASTGIYTVHDMLHIVPCPLCFGDEDSRMQDNPWEDVAQSLPEYMHAQTGEGAETHNPQTAWKESKSLNLQPDMNMIYTFTVDECIKQTFESDHIECPKHGKLEFKHLVPDLVGTL